MSDVLPEIGPLLAEDRLNALGPGSPNLAVRSQLQQLESLIAPKIRDRNFVLACLAGLWLNHDFFDESHAISQDLDTSEGSYWHAILHRREPDYWNSKYWFRRCPRHPIFDDLCKDAKVLTEQAGTPAGCEFVTRQKAWDPMAFVNLCESAAGSRGKVEQLCREIQRCEWRLLFGHCHERAFTV